MRLALIICLTMGIVSFVDADLSPCTPNTSKCKTGDHCISLSWICDGAADCPDNSDEMDCPGKTCPEGFFQCSDAKCITNRWVCDGLAECDDGSDESNANCGNVTCEGYKCATTNQCIASEWVCDGTSDCPDGDDERMDCIQKCQEDEFQCHDGMCITSKWRCDSRADCDDGSDEHECPSDLTEVKCDEVGEKRCRNGLECLTDTWWCDGDADCIDKSDEDNCTETIAQKQMCPPSEFKCYFPFDSAECINLGWKCDGSEDCEDGSDEKNCPAVTCKTREFLCDSNKCVARIFLCDDDPDCVDGTDEMNCPHTKTSSESNCEEGHFDCHEDGSQCILDWKICDGSRDCTNGADESDERQCPSSTDDVCENNNGGCMHTCIPTLAEASKRKCECHKGFELVNGTECVDVDECKIPSTCSQNCVNTKGSYKCGCIMGYELSNNHHCRATQGKRPKLILSSRHDLRLYHLDTFHYTRLLNEEVSGAVAIDFDIRNNIVIWTDVHKEKVFSADLDTKEMKVIIDQDIDTPDGVAVDWVHGNLYLSDTGLNRIEVSRLNGSHRKSLVTENLDEPRALVLDPYRGWMYWTDWGDEAKIEKCGMNGQSRQTIVRDNIVWPNGLTIDYVQLRLYWVDAKLNTIGTTDLDGNDYQLVLKDHHNLGHPFAITVFEDFLYWTDWMTSAVHRISKFGKEHDGKTSVVTTVAPHLKTPMDIRVFHILRQPSHTNHCGNNNGGCSHLCLPLPQDNQPGMKRFECACPNGMELATSTSCVKSAVGIVPSGNILLEKVPQKTKDVVNPSSVPQTEQFGYNVGKVDPHMVPVKPSSAPVVIPDITTEQPVGPEITEPAKTGAAGNVTKLVGTPESEGHGLVTGIVVAVLFLVGIVVIVVGVIILKRHRKKNVNSMNFDNPVYRKTTTEDQLIMERNSLNARDQSSQPLNSNEIV